MLIIGDVHGQYNQYLQLLIGEEKSIQLGDLGFDYTPLANLPLTHRFIQGNHDNYDIKDPHALGDYGQHEGFYYIRGAKSIDRNARVEGVDWWRNEELSYLEFSHAIAQYATTKPDIMLSHDCPHSVCLNHFGYTDHSPTRMALQVALEHHRPKLWIFGHHHKSLDVTIDGTRFICLNILESFRL